MGWFIRGTILYMSRLTVLMPVYNCEQYVGEAIESILNQTFSDFDLLIIDDGSTDRSSEIVHHYAQQDSRIQLLHNGSNIGSPQTVNKGLEIINTELIAFMDSYDISHPERLALQYNYMRKNPDVAMCSAHFQYFGDTEGTAHLPITQSELGVNLFWSCSILKGCTILRKNKLVALFKEEYRYAEDYAMQIENFPHVKMANIDRVLYYYRIKTHNTCIVHRKPQLNVHKLARKMLLRKLGIELNAKELTLFHDMAEGNMVFDLSAIASIASIVQMIIERNQDQLLFDQKTLEKQMINRLFKCFFF